MPLGRLPTNTGGASALDQILLNTFGNVDLGVGLKLQKVWG